MAKKNTKHIKQRWMKNITLQELKIFQKKKQTNKMYMKIFNSNLNEIMGDSNLK